MGTHQTATEETQSNAKKPYGKPAVEALGHMADVGAKTTNTPDSGFFGEFTP